MGRLQRVRKAVNAAGICMVVVAIAGGAGLGCSSESDRDSTAAQSETADRHSDAPDPSHWITIYDPVQAWSGYTLVLYRQRIPALIDMNGRIVHSWPRARVRSRIRLLEDGSLLGIALGRAVVEYDWDGNEIWRYKAEKQLVHHDVIRLQNGNTMLLTRGGGSKGTDDLLEIDRDGKLVWRWRSLHHLKDWFDRAGDRGDITHINSVQVLPKNPLYRAGDERFRPGNLLISARNLSMVFILDRKTGRPVWTFEEELDFQHEALMVEPGYPDPGKIHVFNNRNHSFYSDRRSAVLKVAPREKTIDWRYTSNDFFTTSSGLQQLLPNGNLLIASSRGGRAFEITNDGEIVWEWVPPFDPRRPQRYAYDHCPQLAALENPAEITVQQPAGYRYVDREIYRFARRGLRRTVRVNGQKISALKNNNDCREMTLPGDGFVLAAYGIDPNALAAASRASYAATFRLALELTSSNEEIDLFLDTVDLGSETWRQETVDLSQYAGHRVRLCVETEEVGAAGEATEQFAYWSGPEIGVTGRSERRKAEKIAFPVGLTPVELTPEELAVQKEHLKALGYVD